MGFCLEVTPTFTAIQNKGKIIVLYYFNASTVHLVQFITPNNKRTTYVLIIFCVSHALILVSMHLYRLQGFLTLYFAMVTKLLKLQLNKISRLKCSRGRC